MKILVLNCGSSSIKYHLFDMPAAVVLAKGLIERIGESTSAATQTTDGGELKLERGIGSHTEGMELVSEMLTHPDQGALQSMDEIAACGHRVVHGGERFTGSVLIDASLESVLEEYSDLAPLHNPPNLAGIHEAKKLLPEIPQVGCFDTAFHQTIPQVAYLYALPYSLYEKHKVRRYGFHGTSHKYVTLRAAELLGKPVESVNIITCHLGNGCSMTAVKNGKSVDTSMGLTPLEGLVMGTRTGDFDPAILFYLVRKGYSMDDLDRMVNKQSGLIGISGVSNDLRDLQEKATGGNLRAQLALDIFAYRVKKYIGSYLAVLNGCNAVVFTGGIGENALIMRRRILSDMDSLGLRLDEGRNAATIGVEGEIQQSDSPIKILVIATNEELLIALETHSIARELEALKDTIKDEPEILVR